MSEDLPYPWHEIGITEEQYNQAVEPYKEILKQVLAGQAGRILLTDGTQILIDVKKPQ